MKTMSFRRKARAARAEAPAPARPERELMSRISSGFRIVLLWHPHDDAVSVAVEDFETGRAMHFPVDGARALEAFHHPFVYAP